MNKQNQYINEAAMQVENRYDFRNEEKDSDRKSTRLNSSHEFVSRRDFCKKR